jgi:hypothetical protein
MVIISFMKISEAVAIMGEAEAIQTKNKQDWMEL